MFLLSNQLFIPEMFQTEAKYFAFRRQSVRIEGKTQKVNEISKGFQINPGAESPNRRRGNRSKRSATPSPDENEEKNLERNGQPIHDETADETLPLPA